MNIAIIGAGAAGLCAAKHCLKENYTIDIFEQTGNVGGTWNYTDHIGIDENGLAVHSSMYQGLRTNLPKELMTLEDFPHVQQRRSYLSQNEVLNYLNAYANEFNIKPYLKFYHQVLNVQPFEDSWLVEFQDVKSQKKHRGRYDAVIVCNGHYRDPFLPEVLGLDDFVGGVKHSHDYRCSDNYKGKKVVILGAGPSGLDISQQIARVASRVYLSHKSFIPSLDDCLIQKPLLSHLKAGKGFFQDGSAEDIDEILFCTGYKYNFPFLSPECGVRVKDNYVHPLHKQLICIEHPSLALIGLPFLVCPFPMFDIQARFFLSTMSGHYQLPSKKKMLEILDEETNGKTGIPLRKFHQLGDAQGAYFEDLAKTANIRGIPPVINKLYMEVRMRRNLNDCFRIIDDENWEQI